MADNYIIETQEGPRGHRRLDMVRFTADLARALGGTVSNDGMGSMNTERYAHIVLPGNIKLDLTALDSHADIGKVAVSITPTEIDWQMLNTARNAYQMRDKTRLPRANVNATRPMRVIVADITRRVIVEAQQPLAAIREYVRDRNAAASSLEASCAELAKAVPGLRVKLSDDRTVATLDWNQGLGNPGDYRYISARIYGGDSVSIDRTSSVSAEQFAKIVAILEGG